MLSTQTTTPILGGLGTLRNSPRHGGTFGDGCTVTGLGRWHDKVAMIVSDTEIGLGDRDLTVTAITKLDPIGTACRIRT